MVLASTQVNVRDHFQDVTDPRRGRPVYPLMNMLVMSVCAVICGADDFVAITTWAEARRDWLSRFLDMSTGVPSHDRFNAVLASLKPGEFEKCLLGWITALHEVTDGDVVAIDGKTLRRSYDRASGKSAIHMVSAWASANQISLGQVVTDEKSNEITAIPKLLELIEVSGALVTIDAMGCQTDIAEAIVEAGGDYCLTAKKNQPKLYDAIESHFEELIEQDCPSDAVDRFETTETGHGRLEYRHYYTCPVPESLRDTAWKKLTAIGMAVNITERRGKESTEIRYYILSRSMSARAFGQAVRSHWSIENSCHWQLDVTFGEDQSRIRKGDADANFSILRRTALSLLKNEATAKVGVKNKRLKAASDEKYLTKVLFG